MANRFPLVLDTTDNNKIKEIQTGDNLNLADNSIVGVQNITALGTINAADIKVNGNRLTAQTFADLTDTPSTFVGSPNYFVKVKADGTGLEYKSLSDLGNIQIATITVDTSIVPTTDNVGNIGTEVKKFNEIVGTTLKGNLVSYAEEIVFNATTGKISYAALQGAPGFLSEFADDVGYLRTTDLDTTLAGLFDAGQSFVTDIVGSVFGDDSTVLVDGTDGLIKGNIQSSVGTITTLTSSQLDTTGVKTVTLQGNTSHLYVKGGGSAYDVVIGDVAQAETKEVKIYNAVVDGLGQGSGLGIAQISTSTDLEITAGNRVKINGGVPFKFSSIDATNQLAIAAQEGDVIYNTTTSRLQMYQGSAWKDVNGNVEATTGTSNFNNVVIAGNFTVTGTTTNVETTNTNITDNVITLNQGESGAGVTLGTAGIEIERGTSTNKTLVWNETTDKWTVGAETFVAATFEGGFTGIIGGATPAAVTGTTVNGTTITATTGFVGNLTGNAAGAHTGTLDGDVTGSVFADDSTLLVDGVNGVIPAANLSGTATITVIGNVTGNLTGNAATVTNGVYTIGNQTIGGTKTFSSAILSDVQGDVTGDVTGNIDNATLTVGAASATVIGIGNAASTTTISGILSVPAVVSGNITADNSMSITTATGDGNSISIGPVGTNRAVNLTADVIRISGDVIVPIVAKAGVVGDLKGSVVGDDSTVLIDGVGSKIVGPIASADIAGTLVKATTIENNTTDDLAVNVDGFININAGTDDAGMSKIQMDKTGTNYVEITTEPQVPGNAADVANVAIQATAASGNVVIGTTGSTRNQEVTIYNATVTGSLIGNALGAHAGTFAGDVTGSVFGDDSSVIVDGLAGKVVGPISTIKADVQQISGPGAIDITSLITEITTTGADAYTLDNGILGQVKIILAADISSGTGTVTPTTVQGGTTLTFDAVGESITLIYTSLGWMRTAGAAGVLA